MARCIFIIFTILYYFIINVECSILQTHVVYRHGDRAPVETYPNDPYDDSTWPAGYGQLTKLGKEMEYNLGKWLRKRYKDFISKEWKNGEVEVHSTDYDRTLMSAQCVLAAFYYPSNETRFLNKLNWIPTPIHSAPKKYDVLMNVDESCPEVEIAKEEELEMPEVQEVIKKYKYLFDYLTEKSGKTVNSIVLVDYLFDTLEIERKYNLTLPEWTQKYWSEMIYLSNYSFKLVAMSKKLKRLKAGPLLKEFRDHMLAKTKNETGTQKLYMYSGHDTTVSAVLLGMDVFNDKAPPYASCVIVELHKLNDSLPTSSLDNLVVKTFYKNSTVDPPIHLKLPDCELDCPLTEWIEINNRVIPEDWDLECNPHVDLVLPAFYGTLFTIILFSAFLATSMWLCFLHRKHRQYVRYISLSGE